MDPLAVINLQDSMFFVLQRIMLPEQPVGWRQYVEATMVAAAPGLHLLSVLAADAIEKRVWGKAARVMAFNLSVAGTKGMACGGWRPLQLLAKEVLTRLEKEGVPNVGISDAMIARVALRERTAAGEYVFGITNFAGGWWIGRRAAMDWEATAKRRHTAQEEFAMANK